MTDLLKEPKPSEAALSAFWYSNGGIEKSMGCAYKIDVAPLINEIERLTKERDGWKIDATALVKQRDAAERQNAALVEALRPFERMFSDSSWSDNDVIAITFDGQTVYLRPVAVFRRVRAALAQLDAPPTEPTVTDE